MQIRLIKKKEINKFKNLVNFSYKKNHILSKSNRLINFYYNYQHRDNLNIVGHFLGKELIGAIGFIPYKNWDKSLGNNCHIAFWVKNNKLKSTLPLIQFILKKVRPNFLATSGINKKTSGKIFQKFSPIKKFSNYFIKNDSIECKVSRNLSNRYNTDIKKNELVMVCSKSLNCRLKNFTKPNKTLLYFKKKYLNNRFYNYRCMQFFEKNKIKFFFIFREIKIKELNSKIIRIIDFYGKICNNHSVFFSIQKFLKKYKYEYIDFLCVGLDRELKKIGFTKKRKYNLIPNLFEPYSNSSADRNYCILKNNYKSNVILVKGDGDGDRPNLL